MALSYQNAVSDGSMAFIDISIDYLERSEITAFFDNVLTTAWDWADSTTSKRIVFDTTVPNGVEVTIKRTTDQSELRHKFSGGAAFTAPTLDEDFLQILHIAQEAYERPNEVGTADFFTDINMHGNRITNMADGIDPQDAVTVAQLAAAGGGGGVGFPDPTGHENEVLTSDGTVGGEFWAPAPSPTFTLNAVGAAATTLTARAQRVVYLRDFTGIDPTGVLDSTAGFQAALAATRLQGNPVNKGVVLVVTPGTYKISGTLTVGSKQHVELMPGVTVDSSFINDPNAPLFAISNQTEVLFNCNGAKFIGSRSNTTAFPNNTVEGNNCCFFIYGSDNVTIRDAQVFDFGTESWLVTGDNTGSGPSKNIRIEGGFYTGARRNAAAVVSVQGLTVIGGTYANSSGYINGPWAGIDFEPEANSFCTGVRCYGVKTYNNAGGGMLFAPGPLTAAVRASDTFDVLVDGWHSFNDGSFDSANLGGCTFAVGNDSTLTNRVFGKATVRNSVIELPLGCGVTWFNWDSAKMPRVYMENVQVFDPIGSGTPGGTLSNSCGFRIHFDSAQTGTAARLGNIELVRCSAEDRRAVPLMFHGCLVTADSSRVLDDIQIHDFRSTNFTSVVKSDVSTEFALSNSHVVLPGSVDVTCSGYRPRTVGISTSIGAWGGTRIRSTSGASEFTLPRPDRCYGLHYELEGSESGGAVLRCDPAFPTNRIRMPGGALVTAYNVQAGEAVSVRAVGSDTFRLAFIA